MVINLNKRMIEKSDIMKEMSDLDVYNLYMKLPDLNVLGKAFNSPLRDDDEIPSFGFFIGEGGELCFKDWTLGSGDCIKFVMFMFNISYYEALCKIAVDSNMDINNFKIKNVQRSEVNKDKINREQFIKKLNSNYIGKTSRKWELRDFIYWKKFGINKETLDKYNVEPVSYLHIGEDKTIIKPHYHTYCFNEYKDGKNTFKIYQPFETDYKWLNNHDESVWQGWQQLPQTGKYLIITKSLKDVMSITNIIGVPAVSLQSESVNPKRNVIDELKLRFKYIYILYDNDFNKDINWGREFSKKLAGEFSLIRIEIPDSYKSKDFSDLVYNTNPETAKDLIVKMLTPF